MDNKNNSNSLPASQTAPKQDKEAETSPEPSLVQPAEKEVKITAAIPQINIKYYTTLNDYESALLGDTYAGR